MPDDDQIEQQDPAEAAVEAADDADEQAQPGEPGYVQKRLARLKRQREDAERRASEATGALQATQQRLAAIEAQLAQRPAKAEAAPKTTPDDELKLAKDFIRKVEANRLIIDTSEDPDLVKQAKAQLAGVRADDIAFAHEEVARLQGLKATSESEKRISTQLEGRSAQDAFKERLKAEFGPDAVNSKSDLFKAAVEEFKDLIQMFPDDSGGAVTWMAMDRAKTKLEKTRGGRGSDLDRRRLAIEAGARREGNLSNQIAALKQKGDPQSAGKANSLELDAFLQHHFGNR